MRDDASNSETCFQQSGVSKTQGGAGPQPVGRFKAAAHDVGRRRGHRRDLAGDALHVRHRPLLPPPVESHLVEPIAHPCLPMGSTANSSASRFARDRPGLAAAELGGARGACTLWDRDPRRADATKIRGDRAQGVRMPRHAHVAAWRAEAHTRPTARGVARDGAWPEAAARASAAGECTHPPACTWSAPTRKPCQGENSVSAPRGLHSSSLDEHRLQRSRASDGLARWHGRRRSTSSAWARDAAQATYPVVGAARQAR